MSSDPTQTRLLTLLGCCAVGLQVATLVLLGYMFVAGKQKADAYEQDRLRYKEATARYEEEMSKYRHTIAQYEIDVAAWKKATAARLSPEK